MSYLSVVIPFGNDYKNEGTSIFIEEHKIEDIKDPRTFSKKFGGCKVIYNREKGKLEIQFTQGQVNKFKKYCDKTDDPNNFDFSTILDISYWLKERNRDTFKELVNHKEDDVKIEFGKEHELQGKIESIRSGVESGNHGEGDFDLKVEFIIKDNKCSPSEKSKKKRSSI